MQILRNKLRILHDCCVVQQMSENKSSVQSVEITDRRVEYISFGHVCSTMVACIKFEDDPQAHYINKPQEMKDAEFKKSIQTQFLNSNEGPILSQK